MVHKSLKHLARFVQQRLSALALRDVKAETTQDSTGKAHSLGRHLDRQIRMNAI